MSALQLVLNLSLRNLWRQRRRNSLLLIGITVAIGGVIFLNSLIRGMQVQMVDQTVNNLTGHLVFHTPGYRDDPNVQSNFSLDEELLDETISTLPVRGWAPRITAPSVVMSERETRGGQLVGIVPAREEISFISDVVIEGSALTDASDSRILIGRALLEQLQTKLGRRIVVITQDAEGNSREIGYRIAGVYDATSENLEKQYFFTGLASLQGLLETTNVTELSIRFEDRYVEPVHRTTIEQSFPDLDVISWQEVNPFVAFMYQTVDVVIYLWLAIVLCALIFGLVNTIVTAVLERTRELGLFKAIGMRARLILSQVVIESLVLMVLGICLGFAGFGLMFAWLSDGIDLSAFTSAVEIYGMSPKIVPAVTPQDLVSVIAISLLLAITVSFYPARRAVKLDPLVALRD